jgi:tetratricopeptide (TPR) repeat protein
MAAAVRSSVGEQVLSKAQSSREVIQDFVPLAQSLEWELGQQYLRERGNKAFISDASPVPFVINNDGTLSRNAAELLFTSLAEAEQAGTLEPDIHVLELGIGVGLFARFFLDHFRDICAKAKKDFYTRLTYIAADKSQRMLTDVLRHGVFANHPGRYRMRQIDAMEPDAVLPHDVALAGKSRPLRAVFLNYLLDCLPAAPLDFSGDQVKQLCVRTCVARNVKLEEYTDMSVEAMKKRAADAEGRQELLEVYGLFASEYDYRPVELSKLPYGGFAKEFSRRSNRILLSWGAIQSLERLLTLVSDDGFILVNDYGQTQVSREDEFEHQRFSLATFVGVNFSLLNAYFGGELRPSSGTAEGRCQWLEPPGEEKGIHSRLLGRTVPSATTTRFYELFSQAALEALQEPLQKARACVRMGRFELAASFYNEALEKQPRNWVLLNEISMFLTFSLRDVKAGIDMAKVALSLNPTCSSDLWSTLGDGLYEWGRTAEARSAYQKAIAVNASDVRAHYNLAWCHTREKNFPGALEMISKAFALDKTGEYRDRLLQKQQEVLAQLHLRHQQEYLLLINLVSKFAPKEEKPQGPSPGALTEAHRPE